MGGSFAFRSHCPCEDIIETAEGGNYLERVWQVKCNGTPPWGWSEYPPHLFSFVRHNSG